MTDADYIEQLEIKVESLEDDNKALREMCVRLYRFIDHECLSDRIMCDSCSLFGDGSPCDLTKIEKTLQELGAEVGE